MKSELGFSGERRRRRFCSAEEHVQPSISIERPRSTGPKFGPGGLEHHAAFPAQAQIVAWEGVVGARASWAGLNEHERIEPFSFFLF